MYQIYKNKPWILSNKTITFLKKSFLFSLLSATMLYILVRLFFFEFPFTIGEGFELHIKMLLTIWVFIIACKLFFAAIVMLENNTAKMKLEAVRYGPVFKKSAIIILTATLAYVIKTESNDSIKMPPPSNTSNDDLTADTDNNFLISLPS